jgi:hypothetical protein
VCVCVCVRACVREHARVCHFSFMVFDCTFSEIVIIPPRNAQLFLIIYIYIYIYIYLAYMFRPYPVIIRALRYTKGFKMCLWYILMPWWWPDKVETCGQGIYIIKNNCAFVGGMITIIRENARNNTYSDFLKCYTILFQSCRNQHKKFSALNVEVVGSGMLLPPHHMASYVLD